MRGAREDLRIQRLRAVEQQQVDAIRQIDGQRAQRVAFTDLHEIVEPGRGEVRSTRLVDDVLEAAIQVLTTEGAQRFTMARVAERAGVSVGSLYQYFPNKAAVLFRLQHDEWRQTSGMLCGMLQDVRKTPPERLRTAVHAFIRSECDEAPMRIALDDAAPLYRDAPEAQAVRAEGNRIFSAFIPNERHS